eukprot:760444-Hanusia_phi.AAC.7
MPSLFHAAHDGYDVVSIIEKGADPMASDLDGRRAVHYAAMSGHTLNVIALAAYDAEIDVRTNNGRTALHGSCWNGHTQTALQLVEMGADHTIRSSDGATPLMDAARNGFSQCYVVAGLALNHVQSSHCDTVTALVTIVGADVSVRDMHGRTSLHFAALNGHANMVNCLFNLGADIESQDNDGCRPLHFAAWNGHHETVHMLLNLGANPACMDCNCSTPLHDAALGGRTCSAAVLLDFKADLEARNNRGSTPLLSAASSGHVETTKLLLDANADVNAVNDDRRSALHFATWNCHPRAVLLLLQYGADMRLAGEDGITASDGICHPDFHWPPDILQELHTLRLPNSPMHTAAGIGDSKRVSNLVSIGVDVNCPNDVGDTPLHWAVRNRRLHTSTVLLELGADVMRSNRFGVTACKEMLTYMDNMQQECLEKKILEISNQKDSLVRMHKKGKTKRRDASAALEPHGSLAMSKDGDARCAATPPRAPTPTKTSAFVPTYRIKPHKSATFLSLNNSVKKEVEHIESEGQAAHGERKKSTGTSPALGAIECENEAENCTLGLLFHYEPSDSTDICWRSGSQRGSSSQQQLKTTFAMNCDHMSKLPIDAKKREDTKSCSTIDRSSPPPETQNPGDCNPDDVHNLSALPQESRETHPIRYACMQVDAWASHIPGMRMWQSSKEQSSKMTQTWNKLLGIVTGEILAGDYKGLGNTLQSIAPFKVSSRETSGGEDLYRTRRPYRLSQVDPWVQKKYRYLEDGVIDCANRFDAGMLVAFLLTSFQVALAC